jgi:hypothetical protein
MADDPKSVLGAGARVVRRRQRVLWWVYGINLFLASAAAAALGGSVGSVLDHSLVAQQLVHGFDASTFAALVADPTAPLGTAVPGSIISSLIFFIFMLFLVGGILEVYRRDQTLTTGEFFEACGRFLWRFVRLLIFLLIVLIPIVILERLVVRWSAKLALNAAPPKLGFWVEVVGLLVVLFLLMAARLWFDMAQVRAVAENERVMRRTILETFKLTFTNFGSLFWIYLCPSLVSWIGLALAFRIWEKLVRPEWTGASFLLGQAVLLIWIATRLWQRASETVWYQRRHATPPPVSPEAAPASPITAAAV